MTAVYLVQDIETIPESEIAGDWVPSEADKQRYPDKPPFPPIWVHKVATIGMLTLDRELCPRQGGCAAGGLVGGKSEKDMVQRWSDVASGGENAPALKLVDYNGRGFDVPVLQTRAYRYGIPLKWYFGLLPDNRGGVSQWSKEYRDRYGGNHLDVQEIWTNRGSFRYPHLENLAKLMGLPGKHGIDGSQVHAAYKDKLYEEIDTYCMEDVYQTAFIFQRITYLSGKLSLSGYQKAAESLLNFIADSGKHTDFCNKIDRAAVLLR